MNENLQSKGSKALNLILSIVCFIVALFHIFIAWDTSISLVQQRVFHVFAMVLIYFLMQTQQAAAGRKVTKFLHGAFSLATVVVGGYFLTNTTLAASQSVASAVRLIWTLLWACCLFWLL